jgi:hypothetical protein
MLRKKIGVVLSTLAVSGLVLSGCGSGQQKQNEPMQQPGQQQQPSDTQGTVQPQQPDSQGGGMGQ